MADETNLDSFFSELGHKGHVRLLEGQKGLLLVEVTDGGEGRPRQWFVTIDRGDVGVSDRGTKPDCKLSTDAATFQAVLSGKMNAFAAMLRGLLDVQGEIHLLVALQALFRPSAGAAEQRTAGYAGRGR